MEREYSFGRLERPRHKDAVGIEPVAGKRTADYEAEFLIEAPGGFKEGHGARFQTQTLVASAPRSLDEMNQLTAVHGQIAGAQ